MKFLVTSFSDKLIFVVTRLNTCEVFGTCSGIWSWWFTTCSLLATKGFLTVWRLSSQSHATHPNEVYSWLLSANEKTWLENPMGKDWIFPLIFEQVSWNCSVVFWFWSWTLTYLWICGSWVGGDGPKERLGSPFSVPKSPQSHSQCV